MEDLRLKKLELNVTTLNRRVGEHDTMHVEADKRISEIARLVSVHEETLSVVKEIAGIAQNTYEVILPLAKSLKWVALIAAWAAKISAGALVIWHAGKWLAAKIMVFS